MAIKDLIRPELPPPTPAAERPPNITCEKYTRGEGQALPPLPAGRHVRACPTSSSARSGRSTTDRTSARCPLSRLRRSSSSRRSRSPSRATCSATPRLEVAQPRGRPDAVGADRARPEPRRQTPPIDVDQLRGFTTEDIESFKALGVEVLLHSETYGDAVAGARVHGQASARRSPRARRDADARALACSPARTSSRSRRPPRPTILSAAERPSRSAHDHRSHRSATPISQYSRLSRGSRQCPLSATACTTSRSAGRARPAAPLRQDWSTPSSSGSSRRSLDDERTGPLSEERALELYREAWGAEQLTGMDVFAEGLKILRRFVARAGRRRPPRRPRHREGVPAAGRALRRSWASSTASTGSTTRRSRSSTTRPTASCSPATRSTPRCR
jgi:hypothetical protein